MTKCKCGCCEGKECTCKECPDKTKEKSKCAESCHGIGSIHREKGHGDTAMDKCYNEESNKHCRSEN